MTFTRNVAAVIPVYDDWESLAVLIPDLASKLEERCMRLTVVIVNDGSLAPPALAEAELNRRGNIDSVEIVHLSRNLGHQKAIAIGLAYLAEQRACDAIVVMDADGEDRPIDVLSLLAAAEETPAMIVFATRSQRAEGIAFRALYQIYKTIYRVLTGSSISFGNFCAVPWELVGRVVSVSEIWNHFSAGVIRSKLPIRAIGSARGQRIAGRSKMKLASLVLHGLSAVSVHIDIVAVRLFIASTVLVAAAIGGLSVVVGVRLLTTLAIPGWATNTTVGLTIIMMQALLISLFLVFVILNHRTQQLFIPRLSYRDYILRVERFFQAT